MSPDLPEEAIVGHFRVGVTEFNSISVDDVATGRGILIPAGVVAELTTAILTQFQRMVSK